MLNKCPTRQAFPYDRGYGRQEIVAGSEMDSCQFNLSSTKPNADVALPVCQRMKFHSSTSADQTPTAIREALARYSTFSSAHEIDLRNLTFSDLGDVDSPDHEVGEQRVAAAVAGVLSKHKLLIAFGGDNSITYSVAAGS